MLILRTACLAATVAVLVGTPVARPVPDTAVAHFAAREADVYTSRMLYRRVHEVTNADASKAMTDASRKTQKAIDVWKIRRKHPGQKEEIVEHAKDRIKQLRRLRNHQLRVAHDHDHYPHGRDPAYSKEVAEESDKWRNVGISHALTFPPYAMPRRA